MSQKKEVTLLNFTQDLAIGSLSSSFYSSIQYSKGVVMERIYSRKTGIDGTLIYDKGIIDCYKRILREEGIKSLLKGNLRLNKFWSIPAFNFAFHDTFNRMLNKKKEDSLSIWFSASFISGSLAGFLTTTLFYSLNLAESKLRADQRNLSKKKQFKGLVDVYKQTITQEGISGLYKFFLPSIIRAIVFRGIYFSLYDLNKSCLSPKKANNFFVNCGIGYFVTLIAHSASYPFDTICRIAYSYNSSQFYLNLNYYKQEGFKFFYRNFSYYVIFPSLVGGFTLATYDQIQKLVYKDTLPTSE